VLCISPEIATSLLFDTPLHPGAVEVQAAEREMQLAQGRDFVTLLPSARLLPGEWRKLTVRYGDGAAPNEATVLLYVHPAQAARQVEVRRRVRTVTSLQREVHQWREQARRCEEESAQFQAAQGRPEGLRGLLSAGLMDKQGITSADLLHPKRVRWPQGSALKPVEVRGYRSSSRVAVELRLEFPAGEQPWVAERAELEDVRGRKLRVLPLWQEAMTGARDQVHVIVEAEAAASEAHGLYDLVLKEAGGQRTITVWGVTFP
jgi:uncharacterized protein (TIGR02268 family)